MNPALRPILLGKRPFTPASLPGLVGWYDVTDAANRTTNPVGGAPGSGISVLKNKAVTSRTGNLLKYSEDFSNAAWTKTRVNAFGATDTGAAGAGSFANTARTTDPLGGNTADFVQEDGTAGNTHLFSGANVSMTSGYIWTFSVFVKAAGRSAVVIELGVTAFGGGQQAKFTLSGGGVAAIRTGTPTVAITSLSNGWYLCTIAKLSTSTATENVRIYSSTDDGTTVAFDGDNTKGIFVWGASLVRSDMTPVTGPTLAQGYWATTDVVNDPIHDLLQATAGAQPVLGRTDNKGNMLIQSEGLNLWTKQVTGTGSLPVITLNAGVDPLGGSTATRLQVSKGAGTTITDTSWIVQAAGPALGGAGTVVFDVWLKTNDGSTKVVYFRSSGLTPSTSVTGVWQQFQIVAASTTDNAVIMGLRGGRTPANDDTADLLVWRPSIRMSLWDSTYVPTTGAPLYPGRNGLALARFDGVDDFLKTLQFPLVQPTTVVAVLRQVTWTAADRLFDGYTTGSGLLAQPGGEVAPKLSINAGASLANFTNLGVGVLGVVGCVFNGAASKATVNLVTAASGDAGAGNMQGLTLGTVGAATSGFSNADFAEVLIFNRALSLDEQNKLVQYLARKYGLAL